MESKYKQIEFDIELAKKIQAGEAPGEIVTREGLKARIVCFDYHGERGECILAIDRTEEDGKVTESVIESFADGSYHGDPDNESEYDLLLRVPDDKPKHKFKPFEKVLWKDGGDTTWSCGWFSHYTNSESYPYALTYGWCAQCIPFNEETEHLLGTKENWSE